VSDDEGVEFLDPEPVPDASPAAEERPDTGPRRPLPRWVIGVTGLGIAVVVALALALGTGGAPGAASSSTAPPSAVTFTPPPSLPSSEVFPPPDRLPVGPPLDASFIVPHDPIEATAFGADGSLYLLSPGHLMRLGPHSRHAGDIATGVGAASTETDWRLVAVGDRLWVLGVSGDRTRLIALEAGSGRVLHGGSLDAAVDDSAMLDGHLYLATTRAVYDIAPGATQPRRIRGLAGAASITADAARHRLLLLTTGRPSVVRAYRPGGPTDVAGVQVAPMVTGWVRVVGSAIWLGGFGFEGPVLSRLDPASLRASGSSPLAVSLGPGAVLAATGQSVLWVHSGGGEDDLWCVSSTGAIAQHWPAVYGAIASRAGVAYSAENGATVHRLHLNAACRG
jgi:hypothetical protein